MEEDVHTYRSFLLLFASLKQRGRLFNVNFAAATTDKTLVCCIAFSSVSAEFEFCSLFANEGNQPSIAMPKLFTCIFLREKCKKRKKG